MRTHSNRQIGGSIIGNIFLLAVLAYVVFLGIQWVPQLLESGTVTSILNNVKENYRVDTDTGVGGIEQAIAKQLDVNSMIDLQDSFSVKQNGKSYLVTFSWERELNLLYEKKLLKYEKKIAVP